MGILDLATELLDIRGVLAVYKRKDTASCRAVLRIRATAAEAAILGEVAATGALSGVGDFRIDGRGIVTFLRALAPELSPLWRRRLQILEAMYHPTYGIPKPGGRWNEERHRVVSRCREVLRQTTR